MIMVYKVLFIPVCWLVVALTGNLTWAQGVIVLQNPSFEDVPRQGGQYSGPIKGWHDCGLTRFPGESPPDIHPVPYNAWEVTKMPYHGNTFLGLVTRANDSWESVSQPLSSMLKAGTCYAFSAMLCQSERYRSGTSRNPDQLENFVRPAVFFVWGGNNFCDKAELLGESPPVSNTDWMRYDFVLKPKRDYRFITIEAFYKTPILEAYNGHVLVDNLSDIVPIDCPSQTPSIVAKVSNPVTGGPGEIVKVTGQSNSGSSTISRTQSGDSGKVNQGTITVQKKSFTPVILKELVHGKLTVGQKIRIENLYFKADSVNLLPESYKVLEELAEFLQAFPSVAIEIGGHTNTIPPDDYCNHLSTERARSVKDYLVSLGVPANRLQHKGYGKTEPLISYDKYNKEARLKNQRVEIKILRL